MPYAGLAPSTQHHHGSESRVGEANPAYGSHALLNSFKTGTPTMQQIHWDDFAKVELRVGRVLSAEPFPEARKPAYILQVDFCPGLGVRKSSAQVTVHYRPEDLVGRLVVAVVNFPHKQIGPLMSIGRASVREKVCPYGVITVGG